MKPSTARHDGARVGAPTARYKTATRVTAIIINSLRYDVVAAAGTSEKMKLLAVLLFVAVAVTAALASDGLYDGYYGYGYAGAPYAGYAYGYGYGYPYGAYGAYGRPYDGYVGHGYRYPYFYGH